MNFKRKKLAIAILCYGTTILNPIFAEEYYGPQDMSFAGAWGYSHSWANYVPENAQVEVGSFLYILNNKELLNKNDAAILITEKNSSLTFDTNDLNTDDPGFKNTIVAAYTGNDQSGIAVKVGKNQFSANEKPIFSGVGGDFFSDNIGLDIESANIHLENVSISALKTGVSIQDITTDNNIQIVGSGTKLVMDNFVIKFDGEKFNTAMNDISQDPPSIPANFSDNDRTKNGFDVIGTGNAGETVIHLKNGMIDVEKTAIYAGNAATINVENTNIFSKTNAGSAVHATGKDTKILMQGGEINTHSAGVVAGKGSNISIVDAKIVRLDGNVGVEAQDEDAVLTISNSSISLKGSASKSGDEGYSPAAVSARRKGKVILNDVILKDEITDVAGMKGIYSADKGQVIANAVSYTSASVGAYGVHMVGGSSIELKDSEFVLTGDQSVGVRTSSGEFLASNTKFSSVGPLISIAERSDASSTINITNGSVFKSDTVLLENNLPPLFMDPTDDRFGKLVADDSILAGRIIGGMGTTDVVLQNNTIWSYSGTSNMSSLELNNAYIQLNKPQGIQHNVLEVNKLNSTNSVIELWTEFNGDDSKTDIIRINEEATGKTGLSFKKSGGTGEQTKIGIKVVDAVDQGPWGPKAITANDAFYIDPSSDGYRNGHNSIAAGAYEYFLVKSQKGQEGVDESWYLRSDKIGLVVPPVVPPIIGPIIRPEVISYLSNNQMASTLQRHKWQDRKGQMNESNNNDMGWVRVQSNKSSFSDVFGSTRKSTSSLIHFGVDVLQHNLADNGRLDIGVMGLLGSGETKVHINNMSSKATLDSYNIGAYATWQQNSEGKEGTYIDTWLMHGWNKNHIKGNGLSDEKYNSQMTSLSFEIGHSFALNKTSDQSWYLQPQAQIIWSKANHKHHFEQSTKTDVRWDDDNEISARIGMRLTGDITLASGTQISPFVDLNYWHNPKDQYMQFDNTVIKDKLSPSAVELSAGLQGAINNNVHIWGNVGIQRGKRDYKGLKGQVGVTVKW